MIARVTLVIVSITACVASNNITSLWGTIPDGAHCLKGTGASCPLFGCGFSYKGSVCAEKQCHCGSGSCFVGDACRPVVATTCYFAWCSKGYGPTQCLGHKCVCQENTYYDKTLKKCIPADGYRVTADGSMVCAKQWAGVVGESFRRCKKSCCSFKVIDASGRRVRSPEYCQTAIDKEEKGFAPPTLVQCQSKRMELASDFESEEDEAEPSDVSWSAGSEGLLVGGTFSLAAFIAVTRWSRQRSFADTVQPLLA